ncbi:flagellar basal-body rod protein FlgG [Sneathiella chinensis]|uniref:Flagellar basal-body rod protein FlgG n=1 Tax=Sneathiella chinensis TaxID=349750 RepID=A0ABQ5U7K4_9PROT|nr:flagellar basal-body rod protein FlgG [Sneathiella chinensis]GLQ07401.1 flagellar basal-body rod protein FlgG [Sneathiella chinensis]
MRALGTAATGMLAQQLNVDVISNNIANMTTTGFKRQRAEFQDLLYQDLRRAGAASSDAGTVVPSGIQVGIGVKTASVYRIMDQGGMENTENTYDMAIQGDGFFRVLLPSGEEAYTRAGSFQVSPTGEIVTQDGFTVVPSITVPQDAISVTINTSGEVQVQLDGQVNLQTVGQFDLAIFFNEAGLQPMGDNLFKESPASGAPTVGVPGSVGFGSIRQGYLETSNVNSVSEITSLISAQRAYEMNSKVITTADEMMSVTNQLK